jgi:hypothetical protein
MDQTVTRNGHARAAINGQSVSHFNETPKRNGAFGGKSIASRGAPA